MAFNTMSLVTNLVVAERQGLGRSQAMRVALLGSMLGSPVVGVLITRQLAQREAASATPVVVTQPQLPAPTTTSPTTTTPQPTGATTTPAQPQSGANKVKLDSVVGLDKDQAAQRLTRLGLRVRETTVTVGNPKELGTVVKQQPAPTQNDPLLVDVGSSVELFVGVEAQQAQAAPGNVKVPSGLEGKPFEQAREELQNLNLGVKRLDEVNENVREGHVIRVEPAAGAEVSLLTVITVVVSARLNGSDEFNDGFGSA